jgi:phenylacetate-CoA ligase
MIDAILSRVRLLRAKSLSQLVDENTQFYASGRDRAVYWLSELNKNWGRLTQNVEHYKLLVEQGNCPSQFDSIAEFCDAIPVCTKNVLKCSIESRIDCSHKIDFWKSTGGSTANPIQIPMWNEELAYIRANQWMGRACHGLYPNSKTFLLWGHSHLFGSGILGWVNARKRETQDWILGYCRFSAYDLSREKMQECALKMAEFAPDYVYGYSVALDRFARHNLERKEQIRRIGIKRVQATAESFPSEDSKEVIEEVFGCPVIMEYGAIETGVIASTNAEGDFSVFWRDFFLEAVPNDAGTFRLLVTTLYPRALPLVRFDLGDLVELMPHDVSNSRLQGLVQFSSVIGRCFDGISSPSGKFIHSGLFAHLIREMKFLNGFQMHQKDGELVMWYLASRDLNAEELNLILRRGRLIDDYLGRIKFLRVTELERTVAGKSPAVVVHK